MYLKRKIDKWLFDWFKRQDKDPALVVGIRQCGKTKSIREFAEANNLNIAEINYLIKETNEYYSSRHIGFFGWNSRVS